VGLTHDQGRPLKDHQSKHVGRLTGGQAFTLNNAAEMPAVTSAIGSQLRHQYLLAYQPDSQPHDRKWRKISVNLRLPKNFPFMHVDARQGYYGGGE